MLDDLRQQANATFLNEPGEEQSPAAPLKTPTGGKFLGLTPAQRLLAVVMLLGLTCLLSSLCLLVTEKVVPPFLF